MHDGRQHRGVRTGVVRMTLRVLRRPTARCTWTCLGVVANFTGGQAPHARLANACATTWFAAGNTVYVGDNHAESPGDGDYDYAGWHHSATWQDALPQSFWQLSAGSY